MAKTAVAAFGSGGGASGCAEYGRDELAGLIRAAVSPACSNEEHCAAVSRIARAWGASALPAIDAALASLHAAGDHEGVERARALRIAVLEAD